jgi:ABC-type sugar transport system ATPase subunit
VAAEPDELAAVCDRVICLRRGSIAAELVDDAVSENRILDAIS